MIRPHMMRILFVQVMTVLLGYAALDEVLHFLNEVDVGLLNLNKISSTMPSLCNVLALVWFVKYILC